MPRQTRRARPNARHRVKFYNKSTTTTPDGELQDVFSFHCSGYFAIEKPMRPREVVDGGRDTNEQDMLLIGQWTALCASVTFGMFAYIPSRKKLVAVNGDATDPWGDRKKIHIYIIDNLTKLYDPDTIPGML